MFINLISILPVLKGLGAATIGLYSNQVVVELAAQTMQISALLISNDV